MKELAEWRREVFLGKPVDKSRLIWCPMGKPMFQEVSIPNVIYIYSCAKYRERLPMFLGKLYLEIYKLCKSCYIRKSNRKKPPSDV